ncbi:MAG TPA: bifunctional 2-acylglycerophosphoethanolamine acyltransferase/acyl-ACP synthetase, partial [Bryobacterales bacterium]|nr:bifunctional 2-acylglycerophosphoethanolamine acyltransferase/acyl-ACP synthetase [Bryobacterales bacterium]
KLEPPSSGVGPGWYATGDVVTVDEDGYLFIRDRLRRFAKVAGEMIPLEATERIAAEASPARPSAATAVAEPGRGDVIVLFTCDPDLDRGALAAAARRLGLPELALPRRIVRVDKLPLLASGKVDYVQLKAMAEQELAR